MKKDITNMKILNKIEYMLGGIFNIMALIRTIVCLIFIFFALTSCGTIECEYSMDSWERHQIQFQENMNMLNCEWCIKYEQQIP